MIYVDLKFPVIGTILPSDHGYAVFAAISRVIPEAHGSDWLALETIPGLARGDGLIHINERARLRMRLPQERLPLMLKLAGKKLALNGSSIRLGIPEVSLLRPAASVYARCVTIKKFTEAEPFLNAVARKLDEMGIKGEPELGPRRAFRVGNHTIVGFGLSIHELSDEASVILQERGVGGRRHMGCGFFNPIIRTTIEKENL
jgi:CRISPR-associated endonuclease/helicase Cas3